MTGIMVNYILFYLSFTTILHNIVFITATLSLMHINDKSNKLLIILCVSLKLQVPKYILVYDLLNSFKHINFFTFP